MTGVGKTGDVRGESGAAGRGGGGGGEKKWWGGGGGARTKWVSMEVLWRC